MWGDIPGYEGSYQVSSKGRVRSLTRSYDTGRFGWKKAVRKGCMCKTRADKKGYIRVILCKNGIQANLKIHRLVAMTFISNPTSKPEINHKDRCKGHNCVENLEWVSAFENNHHMWANGGRTIARGSRSGASKLSEDDVISIRERLASGEIGNRLAEEYSVNKGLISAIKLRKIWKHV